MILPGLASPPPLVILGWDLGTGQPRPLSREIVADKLTEFVLVDATMGSPGDGGVTVETHFDIWNPHPLLDINVSLHRRLQNGRLPDGATELKSTLIATIECWNLVRHENNEVQETSQLDPAGLFANGGVLDENSDDGCTISTGSAGVRFKLRVTQTNFSQLEVCAQVVANQNTALGCVYLAQALGERIYLDKPAPIRMTGLVGEE